MTKFHSWSSHEGCPATIIMLEKVRRAVLNTTNPVVNDNPAKYRWAQLILLANTLSGDL
ncbi:MAG: hypothetical protein JRG73_05210 [Deltaproteobacteria bacterium]|nr:hypothetical protein [Deltaproteobacteria bacterium]